MFERFGSVYGCIAGRSFTCTGLRIYEEYINTFLTKVEQIKTKDFEMEPGYPRYIFTSALLLILDRGYILPQKYYMSLGRLAILIHRMKCQHDEKEKNASKTKKEPMKEPKKDKKKGKK